MSGGGVISTEKSLESCETQDQNLPSTVEQSNESLRALQRGKKRKGDEPAPQGHQKRQATNKTAKKVKKAKRQFNWDNPSVCFGQFLMKIAYFGSAYSGLAWQCPSRGRQNTPAPDGSGDDGAVEPLPSPTRPDPSPDGRDADALVSYRREHPTVEGMVFEALRKICLIRDRISCKFSRCGRTDKGVHAAGNYISARLRLKPKRIDEDDHYDYPAMLNSVLPHDIRVLEAVPVPSHFDARFQCLYRVYKYFFCPAGLNIFKMREGAKHFVGEHDFRNFCKIDAEKVRHFRRLILWVEIRQSDPFVWEIEIAGLSFLWHQIRCMVAILFLIGQGLEEPAVIDELLDITRRPRKPSYQMAPDAGLVLYDCMFEGIHFHSQSEGQHKAVGTFKKLYAQHITMLSIYRCLSLCDNRNERFNINELAISALEENPIGLSEKAEDGSCDSDQKGGKNRDNTAGFTGVHPSFLTNWGHLLEGLLPAAPKKSNYIPLLSRPTNRSLEDKRDIARRKQALNDPNASHHPATLWLYQDNNDSNKNSTSSSSSGIQNAEQQQLPTLSDD